MRNEISGMILPSTQNTPFAGQKQSHCQFCKVPLNIPLKNVMGHSRSFLTRDQFSCHILYKNIRCGQHLPFCSTITYKLLTYSSLNCLYFMLTKTNIGNLYFYTKDTLGKNKSCTNILVNQLFYPSTYFSLCPYLQSLLFYIIYLCL